MRSAFICLLLAACGDDVLDPPDSLLVYATLESEVDSRLQCGWQKFQREEVDSQYGWPVLVDWDSTQCEWVTVERHALELECYSLGLSGFWGAYTAHWDLSLRAHGRYYLGELEQRIVIDETIGECSALYSVSAWPSHG